MSELTKASPNQARALDPYEAEKVDRTRDDALHLTEGLVIMSAMLDEAERSGITVANRPSFTGLRVPGGPFGPDNGTLAVTRMVEGTQLAMASSMTEEQYGACAESGQATLRRFYEQRLAELSTE